MWYIEIPIYVMHTTRFNEVYNMQEWRAKGEAMPGRAFLVHFFATNVVFGSEKKVCRYA